MPRIVFGRQVEQTASGRGDKSYRTPEILFLIHCTVFRFSHLCPGWVYTKSFEVMCKIQKWTGKKYEISDQFGPGPNRSFKTRTNSEGIFRILGPDRTRIIRFWKISDKFRLLIPAFVLPIFIFLVSHLMINTDSDSKKGMIQK